MIDKVLANISMEEREASRAGGGGLGPYHPRKGASPLCRLRRIPKNPNSSPPGSLFDLFNRE